MPTITYRPKDIAIDQHGEAIFVCEAEGNPPPLVFWSLEGNRTLIFPGERHGKFRAGVNKNGQSMLTVQVNYSLLLLLFLLPLILVFLSTRSYAESTRREMFSADSLPTFHYPYFKNATDTFLSAKFEYKIRQFSHRVKSWTNF